MKKMFKLIGLIALSVIIGFGMMSCGDDNGNNNGDDPRPATPEIMSTKSVMEYFKDNNIRVGWNLGNTLDAVNFSTMIAEETGWSNPVATQALFNGVKESGFDIVRIPCTWLGHIGSAPDYKISEARLARVAEVVNYAKTAGIKAMVINIHHDGNAGDDTTWGFVDMRTAVNNPAKKTEIQNQISKVWTQIAEYFKNYGDYLIFETLNEVHNGNWGNNATNAEQDILFDWNQSALSAIRATGGNNASRFIAVPGLGATEPRMVLPAHNRGKLLPNDGANGTSKLIVAVHLYDPSQYTTADPNNASWPLIHTWGSTKEREELTHEVGLLKTAFIDNGIAVYFGEYGAPTDVRSSMSTEIKNTHLDYIGSVVAAARANSIVPIYWDSGMDGGFKILERSNGRPKTGFWTDVLSAIMNAINNTTPLPPGGGGLDGPVTGEWTWDTFTDSDNNGTSTVTMSETAGAYTFTGSVTGVDTSGYEYGFAGWSATPDSATLAALKSATSISFKVKGDGKTYKIMLPTSNITDYSYYFATFPTTNNVETTVTINISEFSQPDWGNPKVALNKSLLDKIQWQTNDGALGTFNITISDLTLN